MRKVGMTNLEKAKGFHGNNWEQTFRYGDLAATKLKQLKDRRLETVELINDALSLKFDALIFLGRQNEAMECAKERYTLWAMNHLRNPGSIRAALGLIQSCIHSEELEDAERYARHAYFMVAEMTDNFIPVDEQPRFLADVSYWLAEAIYRLAVAGGIPPEGKQKAGEEAIKLARTALELRIQVYGTESPQGAGALSALADILDYFNDVDDDEIFRLLEQSIAVYRRVEGSSPLNVAKNESKLGNAYFSRARRAQKANDLDRCLANTELVLPHYREAARIYRVINHMDSANNMLREIVRIEENIRLVRFARTAAAAAATRG